MRRALAVALGLLAFAALILRHRTPPTDWWAELDQYVHQTWT